MFKSKTNTSTLIKQMCEALLFEKDTFNKKEILEKGDSIFFKNEKDKEFALNELTCSDSVDEDAKNVNPKQKLKIKTKKLKTYARTKNDTDTNKNVKQSERDKDFDVKIVDVIQPTNSNQIPNKRKHVVEGEILFLSKAPPSKKRRFR